MGSHGVLGSPPPPSLEDPVGFGASLDSGVLLDFGIPLDFRVPRDRGRCQVLGIPPDFGILLDFGVHPPGFGGVAAQPDFGTLWDFGDPTGIWGSHWNLGLPGCSRFPRDFGFHRVSGSPGFRAPVGFRDPGGFGSRCCCFLGFSGIRGSLDFSSHRISGLRGSPDPADPWEIPPGPLPPPLIPSGSPFSREGPHSRRSWGEGSGCGAAPMPELWDSGAPREHRNRGIRWDPL